MSDVYLVGQTAGGLTKIRGLIVVGYVNGH